MSLPDRKTTNTEGRAASVHTMSESSLKPLSRLTSFHGGGNGTLERCGQAEKRVDTSSRSFRIPWKSTGNRLAGTIHGTVTSIGGAETTTYSGAAAHTEEIQDTEFRQTQPVGYFYAQYRSHSCSADFICSSACAACTLSIAAWLFIWTVGVKSA